MTAVQIYRKLQSLREHVPLHALPGYYADESFSFNRALVEQMTLGDDSGEEERGARFMRKLELSVINKSFPGLMEKNRIRPHRFSLLNIISDFFHP
jgi:hypothetical protein